MATLFGTSLWLRSVLSTALIVTADPLTTSRFFGAMNVADGLGLRSVTSLPGELNGLSAVVEVVTTARICTPDLFVRSVVSHVAEWVHGDTSAAQVLVVPICLPP